MKIINVGGQRYALYDNDKYLCSGCYQFVNEMREKYDGKSNWREDDNIPNKYITDKGYEVYIEDATDENDGNPTGEYEITLWMVRGGNYESLGTYKKFDKALKEMEIWVADNPHFGDE